MSQSGLQPTIERRRVRLGGAWLAYEVAGAGPPVVLVHGLSGSTRWWARTIGSLAERLRVHAVDLVGFGRSRGRQRFVLGEAASCLVGWMDLLAIDRASFVGHSMGGVRRGEPRGRLS